MKIKKYKGLVIIAFVFSMLFIGRSIFAFINTEHATWYINYGIKVPSPSEEIIPFYESGPRGEGEIYTICKYNSEKFQKLESMKMWSRINNQSDIDRINDHIKKIKNWITDNDTINIDIFSKYPLSIKKGYLYYLESKSQDGFFLLICNRDNKELYALELTN